MSGFTNGLHGTVMLGIVNWVCGTVGYFTIPAQIPQIRKVGRSVHEQDIIPKKLSGF